MVNSGKPTYRPWPFALAEVGQGANADLRCFALLLGARGTTTVVGLGTLRYATRTGTELRGPGMDSCRCAFCVLLAQDLF